MGKILESMLRHTGARITRKYFKPEIKGIENLKDPKEKLTFMLFNHTRRWDGPVLLSEFDYRKLPGINFVTEDFRAKYGRIYAKITKELGCHPISQRGDDPKEHFEEFIKRTQEQGRYVGGFPEGGFVKEEGLGHYHRLLIKLASIYGARITTGFMDLHNRKRGEPSIIEIGPTIETDQTRAGEDAYIEWLATKVRDTTLDMETCPYTDRTRKRRQNGKKRKRDITRML